MRAVNAKISTDFTVLKNNTFYSQSHVLEYRDSFEPAFGQAESTRYGEWSVKNEKDDSVIR